MPRKEAGIHYMGQYPAPSGRDVEERDITRDIRDLTEEILLGTFGDTRNDGKEVQFPTPSGGGVGAFT